MTTKEEIHQEIKSQCKKCLTEEPVRSCTNKDCHLYPMRVGRVPKHSKSAMLRAIRSYCLHCNSTSRGVQICNGFRKCPIFAYRFGYDPEPNETKVENVKNTLK